MLLIYPLRSLAEENTGKAPNEKVMSLTLEQGKVLLLHRNLDIAIQMITPRISEARIESEKGAFDPELSASLKHEDSTTPLSSRSSVAAGGRTSVGSESNSLSAGISGRSPIGTQYSVDFNDTGTENTFNDFNAEHDSFAGITITQPLLKDFGAGVNLYNITIAQKNRDISITELKQHLMDTVTDYKRAYWDLVQALDDLKVKEEAAALAESLLDLSQKRLKAEVASPLEVTQAEAGVAMRREDLIVAGKTVKDRENTLKRLISQDIYSLRGIEIRPADTPTVAAVTPDPEESFREGLENRPDYEKIKTEMDKSDITVQYAKNRKFPNIDLEASYGYNGVGSSLGDSTDTMTDNPVWSLGVMVKFPLGNNKAKGDMRAAKLEAEQGLLNLKKLEQDIIVEIDNAIRDLETNKQRISAAKISTRLAEESLKAEELKLKEGLSTSHNVLQFQDDLTAAKSREISAVIDYNKSLAELSRVKGVVLKEEGIDLSGN
ncbi:MAG: TolC family protein [Nitrospirota bacterium]|nr:TolC family protein [Nitrospirota bacterium]